MAFELHMLGDPQPRKQFPKIKEYLEKEKREKALEEKLREGQEKKKAEKPITTPSPIITPSLEQLVDFCGTKIQKYDKDAVYSLFNSAGKNPEDYYQQDNQGKIRIENQRIVYINAENIELSDVSPEIGNLSSLQRLDLDNNQLTSVPPEIGNLSSLQRLVLYKNQLTFVPPEIGNLSSLQGLYLYNNQLTSIPSEIGNLSSLHSLVLRNNQLTSIPPEIGNLTSLRWLYLNNNQLDQFSKELCEKLRQKGVNVTY